jgi:hypothetical protein
LATLLKEIQEDYELCINYPHEYQNKVDLISSMFKLRGKNKLSSDNCPVYIVGKFQLAPIVMFAVNPGYSSKNNIVEDAVARKSWNHYQDLYLNFYQFFAANNFKSPYYSAMWQLLSGLTGEPVTLEKKWDLFDKYLTTVELIPYHSEGIVLPSNLTGGQLKFLTGRFERGIEFILKFNPKLIIFNGKIWHTLLIEHNKIENYVRVPLTGKFNLYFFKFSGISCVLFDKFFQRHFWGITNKDRMVSIPRMIHSKFENLSKDLELIDN